MYTGHDALIIIHFLFILFVVTGGLLILRWPQMVWLHLPAACWGAFIEFAGWIEPLTPLNTCWLGGEAPLHGDFCCSISDPGDLSGGAFRLDPVHLRITIAVNLLIYVMALYTGVSHARCHRP